jgi:hypothetical protein
VRATTAPPSPAYSTESDTAHRLGRRSVPVARVAWWGAVVALAGYFVATKAAHYFYRFDAQTYGRYWAYAGWLVAHITGGAIALALGPLRFWTALRRRYARRHRWTGRGYVAAVAFGATMAAVMLTRSQGVGWVYRLGLAGLTLAWVGTTALAAWGCWALPLLVTEFVLQGRKILAAPARALPPLPE